MYFILMSKRVRSLSVLLLLILAVFGVSKVEAAYPLNVTAGTNRTWLPDAMGYNGKAQGDPWRTLPFSNTNLINVLDRSKINTFRYPGGTVANYWDWVNGKDYDTPGNYKLSNLKLAYDQIGFTPVFTVNMLTPTNITPAQRLTSALSMLTNAQSLGLPVARVELGNEFYLSDPDYVAEFPTGVEYGQRCQTWIAAFKASFPGVKCAIDATMESRARLDVWTAETLSACSNYDALVIHWYPQSALEPAVVTGDGTLAEQNAQWALFNATNGVDIMLGQPNQDWNQMTAANNVPVNADIWATEFNLKDSNGAVRQTWANGLFVANQIHAYLKDGRVSRVMLHNWLSSNKQAMFGTNNELSHVLVSHGQGSLATTPYQFAAAGQVMRMYAEVADNATNIAPLAIESSPQIFTPGVAPYAAVYGWRFTAGGTNRAIFVNSSSVDYDVNVSGIATTNFHLRQVSGNPHTFVTGENATVTRVTSADAPAILRLPAYSVTTLGGPADPAPTGSSPNPPAFSSNPIIKPAVNAYNYYSQTLTNVASDPNGDKLSFKKITGPSWLTVWSDGRLTGAANNSNVGTNEFLVQVSDPAGRSNQATLQITVNIGAPSLPTPVASRVYGVAEDTFIYSGAEANNPQPLDTFLDIRSTSSASFSRVPYLKFNVDTLPGTATNVTLNIYSVDVAATVTVYSNSPNWSATTLTWNNRPGYPSFGTTITNNVVLPGWNQINLTGTIKTNGNSSFALNESANLLQQFSSSRGTNPPYLQITFSNAPPTNYAPVFTANPFSKIGATEDLAYTGQTLAGSATDAEGDPLLYFKQSGPAWLSVGIFGALSGTPANSDVGTNTWTIQATDGLNTNIATMKIVVTNVNDAPLATSLSYTNGEDLLLSITLNGSDVDGPVTNFTVLTLPASGILSGTAPGLSYQPATNFTGLVSFTYSVNDGSLTSSVATVTITITNINDTPFFTANPVTKPDATEAALYTGQTIAGSATDVDAGTTLTYTKQSGPTWLSIAVDGALSGTPGSTNVGTNSWTVQVSDGVASDTATLRVLVTNAPVVTPPTLAISASPPESATITWTPIAPGWVLQKNDNLNATNWINHPGGTNSPVIVPLDSPGYFYRLFKP
jgi:hypothetical protein